MRKLMFARTRGFESHSRRSYVSVSHNPYRANSTHFGFSVNSANRKAGLQKADTLVKAGKHVKANPKSRSLPLMFLVQNSTLIPLT